MFYVGCFLTKEGGYYGTARKILGMGGNTYQVFTRNPRGGGVLKAADPEDFRRLNELTATGKVHPPLAHDALQLSHPAAGSRCKIPY